MTGTQKVGAGVATRAATNDTTRRHQNSTPINFWRRRHRLCRLIVAALVATIRSTQLLGP